MTPGKSIEEKNDGEVSRFFKKGPEKAAPRSVNPKRPIEGLDQHALSETSRAGMVTTMIFASRLIDQLRA
jgi:hypothetical protein